MANDPSRVQPAPLALLLDAAWRQLNSTRTVVLLLVLVAVALALTAAIPQAPPEARADPQALQRWLATSAGLPRWIATLFNALGLFQISHSLWFRFLAGLAALSLLVACVEGIDALRRPVPGSFPPADAPAVTLPKPAESVQVHLLRLGFRETALDLGEADVWHGQQRRPGRWGRPLLHAGLLLAVAGAWVLARWGWQSASWAGRVGQLHPTGHGTPYQVRLDAFDLSWTSGGSIGQATSRVTVLEGGTVVKQATLGAGRPVSVGGVLRMGQAQVRQVGVAPRLLVGVRDAQGRAQLLESPSAGVGPAGQVALRFAAGGSEQYVTVGGRDELLRLVYEPSPPAARPAVRVEVQKGGDAPPSIVDRVSQTGQARAGDLVLDLDVTWEPVLRAGHTPGAGLILGGLLLALAGAGAALAWAPRGVWLREEEGQSVLLPSGAAWEIWWLAFRDRLEAECET